MLNSRDNRCRRGIYSDQFAEFGKGKRNKPLKKEGEKISQGNDDKKGIKGKEGKKTGKKGSSVKKGKQRKKEGSSGKEGSRGEKREAEGKRGKKREKEEIRGMWISVIYITVK